MGDGLGQGAAALRRSRVGLGAPLCASVLEGVAASVLGGSAVAVASGAAVANGIMRSAGFFPHNQTAFGTLKASGPFRV